MCSGKVGGPPPALPPRKGGVPKKEAKISFAVKNRASGQWETPPLDEGKQKTLENAIETLRQGRGEQTGPMEVTQEGVLVKEKKGWRNLLLDEDMPKGKRESLLATHKLVTSLLGENEIWVVPLDSFEALLQNEMQFFQSTSDRMEFALIKIQKEKGGSGEPISSREKRAINLAKVAGTGKQIITEVKKKLQRGESREALEFYVEQIPIYYEALSTAMLEWNREQRIIEKQVGKTPISIDVEDFNALTRETVEFISCTEHVFPQSVSQASEQITSLQSQFSRVLSVEESIKQEFQALEETEKKFNGEVAAAFNRFNEPGVNAQLLEKGWSQAEIDTYKAKLQFLKQNSDKLLSLLNTTLETLAVHGAQRAMEEFSGEMKRLYPVYIKAYDALLVPQKLAQWRTPSEAKSLFNLDLLRVGEHGAFLENIHVETPIPELTAITQAATPASQKRALLQLLDHLYTNQVQSRELTKKIEAFVALYQKERALFERLMQKHGISPEESAFLFNHYATTLTALSRWDAQFAHVIDLVSQNDFEGALQAYSNLIIQEFPQYVDQVGGILLTAFELNDSRVKVALEEFLQETKSQISVNVLLSTLNTQRLFTNPELVFKDAQGYAAKTGIKPSLEGDQALLVMKEQSLKKNQEVTRSEMLKKEISRFAQFFTLENPKVQAAWDKILKELGWSPKEVQEYIGFLNQYNAKIEEVIKIWAAYKTETDPQRKTEWAKQFDQRIAEMKGLSEPFARVGGFKKLKLLQQAAQKLAQVEGVEESLAQKLQKEAQHLASSLSERIKERVLYISEITKK